jgi:hypothetical protein
MSSAKPIIPSRGPGAFAARMGVAALIGLVAGIGGGVFGDWPGAVGLALTALVSLVAMGGCLLVCLWWWRGIDEAAREAHKWAWWWGGCTGMAIGGVILMTALSREDIPLGDLAGSEILALGMALMLTCQIIGYGVAWLVWWAQRR